MQLFGEPKLPKTQKLTNTKMNGIKFRICLGPRPKSNIQHIQWLKVWVEFLVVLINNVFIASSQ